MTAIILPNSNITTGFVDDEDGWGAAMNKNLRLLDALVQPRVLDRNLSAPPASPAAGDTYIVGASATGTWATHENKLAIWTEGDDLVAAAWLFITPKAGWRLYVVDEANAYQFDGAAWVADTGVTYRQLIGDGVATSIAVNHLLGTRDVSVTVYRNSTPWEDIPATFERTTADIVTVGGFTGTPTTDEYVIVVRK